MGAAPSLTGVGLGPDARPVWLLLHELDDASAEPLRRHLAPAAEAAGGLLLALPAPALLRASGWSLRMDSRGHTQATLQIGPHRLDAPRLRAVVNRLGSVQIPATGPAAPDAAYLQQEWQAVLAFWLASLPCPVLNAAHPTGLSGPVAPPAWWRMQAVQAGLPAWSSSAASDAPPAGTPRLRLLVLGDRCVPAPEFAPMFEPNHAQMAWIDGRMGLWLDALPAFAQALGLSMLEVWLAREPSGAWVLDGADPRPGLRELDDATREALLASLRLGPGQPSTGAGWTRQAVDATGAARVAEAGPFHRPPNPPVPPLPAARPHVLPQEISP